MAAPVIKDGTVEVVRPFMVKEFDEDEGWVEVKIKPGTYQFRVLNMNGWKPRQLLINGSWVDVMNQCEELEDSLNESVAIGKVEEAKMPLQDLVLLRALYNEKLHSAIESGDQEFVDQFIANYPDKTELSWYEDGPLTITKELQRDLAKMDAEVDAGLYEEEEVDETTTVANIAPTVDYIGHVAPVTYLSIYTDVYKEPKKDKDEKDKEEDSWVGLLGRIMDGESVRPIIGEMIQVRESVQSNLQELYESMKNEFDLFDFPGTISAFSATINCIQHRLGLLYQFEVYCPDLIENHVYDADDPHPVLCELISPLELDKEKLLIESLERSARNGTDVRSALKMVLDSACAVRPFTCRLEK